MFEIQGGTRNRTQDKPTQELVSFYHVLRSLDVCGMDHAAQMSGVAWYTQMQAAHRCRFEKCVVIRSSASCSQGRFGSGAHDNAPEQSLSLAVSTMPISSGDMSCQHHFCHAAAPSWSYVFGWYHSIVLHGESSKRGTQKTIALCSCVSRVSAVVLRLARPAFTCCRT